MGAEASLRVGADARPITPDLAAGTVYLAGFDVDRPAQAIHDDLMVRTMALASGHGEPVVMTVCDLIGLTRVHGAKGPRVVACTHTHHGPDMLGFWGKPTEGVSGIDWGLLDRIRSVVAASQEAAIESMEPASLRAASIAVPELVANVRDPDIVDDELSVIRAYRPDGSVIVTFCAYPCHPEVVASDSTDVTADYAGHLCRAVESVVGGTAIFAAGALGGMLSPSTEVRTHEEAQRYGAVLADAAEKALAGATEVPDPTVSFARSEVEFPLQNPIYELGIAMELAPPAERRGENAVTEVSVVKVGPATLACVPGELFPKLGLRLKESMRAAGAEVPVVVGLADDELGYILPEEDFVFPADYLDPGKHYEESFSAGPRLGPLVVEAVEKLVRAW